jgi:GT2 family glycosyltransferase
MTWGRVTWLQSLIALEGQDAPDGPRYDGEHRVDWIPGCSILFRTAALREVGFFDEDFFAYHEDVDWAARAGKRGWEMWYTGDSRIEHAIHASSGGEAASYMGFRSYLSARNSVLYARRHGSLRQQAVMAGAVVATLPFQWLRRRLRGQQAGVHMKLKGWRDGLAGKPVPLEELGLR